MTATDWDSRFVRLAVEVSTWSKDPERRVGAVIVSPDRRRVAFGYNGFPRGIADDAARLARVETKNGLTVHAELNAILNAPFELEGCTLYVTQPPCHECAKAIVQAGIRRVLRPGFRTTSKWLESWFLADEIFKEASVELRLVLEEEMDRCSS